MPRPVFFSVEGHSLVTAQPRSRLCVLDINLEIIVFAAVCGGTRSLRGNQTGGGELCKGGGGGVSMMKSKNFGEPHSPSESGQGTHSLNRVHCETQFVAGQPVKATDSTNINVNRARAKLEEEWGARAHLVFFDMSSEDQTLLSGNRQLQLFHWRWQKPDVIFTGELFVWYSSTAGALDSQQESADGEQQISPNN